MTKAISGLFGGPKVDKAAQARQEQMLAEQDARLKKQEEEQAKAEEDRKKAEAASGRARRGRAGGESLLSGLETGVAPIDPSKRTSLG